MWLCESGLSAHLQKPCTAVAPSAAGADCGALAMQGNSQQSSTQAAWSPHAPLPSCSVRRCSSAHHRCISRAQALAVEVQTDRRSAPRVSPSIPVSNGRTQPGPQGRAGYADAQPAATHTDPSPQQLTARINHADIHTLPQLLQGRHVNALHAAAALSKLQPSPVRIPTHLIPTYTHAASVVTSTVLRHAAQFDPTTLSIALWAASKVLAAFTQLQSRPAASSHQEAVAQALTGILRAVAALVQSLPSALPALQPRHLASTVYTLGIIHKACGELPAGLVEQAVGGACSGGALRVVASEALQVSEPYLAQMTTQGVSNSLYGAALLGLQPHDTWMNPALDSLQSQCQRMEPQHLANTMWALARMGYYPGDDWFVCVATPLLTTTTLAHMWTPQGVATLLWACGTLQLVPSPPQLHALLGALRHHATAFSAQDVSNVMLALADMYRTVRMQHAAVASQAAPATPAVAVATATADSALAAFAHTEYMDRSDSQLGMQLDSLGSQWHIDSQLGRQSDKGWDIRTGSGVDMSWQGQRAAMRHAAMYVLLCSMQRPQRPAHAPVTAGAGSEASPPHARAATRTRTAPRPAGAASSALATCTTQHLANILWACSALDISPPMAWQDAYWCVSQPKLAQFTQQELAMLLLGLGRLQLRPPRVWWAAMLAATYTLLPRASPRLLAHSIWAMARLRRRPPREWVGAFLQGVERLGDGVGGKAMACIRRSLRALRVEQ